MEELLVTTKGAEVAPSMDGRLSCCRYYLSLTRILYGILRDSISYPKSQLTAIGFTKTVFSESLFLNWLSTDSQHRHFVFFLSTGIEFLVVGGSLILRFCPDHASLRQENNDNTDGVEDFEGCSDNTRDESSELLLVNTYSPCSDSTQAYAVRRLGTLTMFVQTLPSPTMLLL